MELKTKKPMRFNDKEPVVATGGNSAHISEEFVKKLIDDAIAIEKAVILHDGKVEMDKQLQSAQASYISVFGIFASVTSFLGIEFQFLKGLENIIQVLGFTLVLGAFLLGFNIGLGPIPKF